MTKEITDLVSELFPEAQHYLTRDHHNFSFSSSHAPTLVIEPGEFVHVQTWDCYRGAISNNENALLEIDSSLINPATGPIFVTGAEPGDTLSVTLHDIRPGARGVARTYPGDGQLQHLIEKPFAQFFDVSNGVVTMNERVSFPASPMLGVIGVAPEEGEVPTMPAGRHGGNLDNNKNTIGSTIHLPVKHAGALLAIGDMHASMGDGEICGTGIEIAGDVLLSTALIKGKGTAFPVTETANSWITHGVSTVEDLYGAMRIACEEAAELLVSQWGFTIEEAFIFLSVQGNLGIAQAVHPAQGTVIAKMEIPKISACPKPFKEA
jgi:amidase